MRKGWGYEEDIVTCHDFHMPCSETWASEGATTELVVSVSWCVNSIISAILCSWTPYMLGFGQHSCLEVEASCRPLTVSFSYGGRSHLLSRSTPNSVEDRSMNSVTFVLNKASIGPLEWAEMPGTTWMRGEVLMIPFPARPSTLLAY